MQRVELIAMALVVGNAGTLAAGWNTSRPYKGHAHQVPGLIEAEDFDEGAEGVAFHDTDDKNELQAFCKDCRATPVDLEHTPAGLDRNPHNAIIGAICEGEWVQYTIDVKQTGAYKVVASLATPAQGNTFRLDVDGASKAGPLPVPRTGTWDKYVDVPATLNLTKGRHVVRFVAESKGKALYNLDTLSFELVR